MRIPGALAACVTMLAYVASAGADAELKNDGFVSESTAAFQGGFVTGEIGASRFVAPEAGRQLLKVQLLYGGAAVARTITLKVWDDSAGTNAPGAELYSGDFTLTGSNSAMQELATTDVNVTLPMQFRVGVVFGDGCPPVDPPAPPEPCGFPSIARDLDGTVDATKNYLFAIPGGWGRSSPPVSGDWVIRAFVSGGAGPGPGSPDAGPVTGGQCNGNGDCPVGEFCDTAAHACTFECRDATDCGGDICNSLGQCVAGDREGGGCCRTDQGGGEVGMVLLGLGLGAVLLRRRRA